VTNVLITPEFGDGKWRGPEIAAGDTSHTATPPRKKWKKQPRSRGQLSLPDTHPDISIQGKKGTMPVVLLYTSLL